MMFILETRERAIKTNLHASSVEEILKPPGMFMFLYKKPI